MYESFFQFSSRPFVASPLCDRYYPSRSIEAARQLVTRAVERAEGVGLIIGPPGCGKTMLCQVLAEQFRATLSTVVLAHGQLPDRRALLQAILYELGLPYRGLDVGELQLALVDHLSTDAAGRRGMLLIVDEAHTLRPKQLEELRLVCNLTRDAQSRIRLVLAGGPLLEERLASPRLTALSQRVSARCFLEPMNRAETEEFVRAQLALVGSEADEVFDANAWDAIYRATDGVGRLVNQVCDHSLILAYANAERPVGAACIEEAWADLQQLPTPWGAVHVDDAAREHYGENIVEFGGLDDEPSPTAGEIGPKPEDDSLHVSQRFDEVERQLAQVEEDFRPVGTIGPDIDLPWTSSVDPFDESFDEEEVVFDRYASFDSLFFRGLPQVTSAEGRVLASLLAPFVQPQGVPQLAIATTPEHDAPEDDSDQIVVEDDPAVDTLARRGSSPPSAQKQEYRQLFAKLRRG